jgi:tRNA modification GTPase
MSLSNATVISEDRHLDIARDERSAGLTYVIRLTAEGRGAIAVVRLWGPKAVEIAAAAFRPNQGSPLAPDTAGRLRLGRIGQGAGDEVVAIVLEARVPTVEIHCHGGTAAVALVVDALEAAGATRGDSARLAGAARASADSLASLALLDLARAPTIRTAEILLDQVNGALRQELELILGATDERPALALAGLHALVHRSDVGLRLLSGWNVVIAGRPNVGKSRLLNALAGFPRAIVDSAPGTTRDVVSHLTSFGGWPVVLADTAGQRASHDAIENLGIDRARHEQAAADLVLLVLDRSEPLQQIDRELIATNRDALLVANKSDLPPAWCAGDLIQGGPEIVTVSAERGNGISSLIAAIATALVPEPPRPGDAVPFRTRQRDLIVQARSSLLAGDRAGARGMLASLLRGPAHVAGGDARATREAANE